MSGIAGIFFLQKLVDLGVAISDNYRACICSVESMEKAGAFGFGTGF